MSQQRSYIHPTAIVDEGCTIGTGVRIWHFSHLMSGSRVGDNCVIGQNVFIAASVVIGSNVHIQNNVSLYDGVICEDDVFIGPSAVFTNVINPRSGVNRRNEFQKTVVRRGATIGANATIICGNEIGSFAFVGAGAVVTKPVAAYAVVTGNPARASGWMSEHGQRLEFNSEGIAVCPGTKELYELKNQSVIKLPK